MENKAIYLGYCVFFFEKAKPVSASFILTKAFEILDTGPSPLSPL